ncbi:MAG TPA: ABC transporter permease [Vicinamibacterales bacterium]|nr:ABC transporter permease [Vicinamibacterales bacterium]
MIQDLRFAIRSLVRRKALLALAVATLALGVGASTALFSLVNGVLLRPLPYRAPERLAILWHVFGHGAQDLPAMHPLDYRDYGERSRTLEELTIATGQQLILGGDANPEIVQVGAVAAGFFRFLGVEPQLGRHFLPHEDVPEGPRVAILSHRLWQSRFAGDPAIVGRTIELNAQRAEIVGVLPAGFRLELPAETYALRDSDLYRPAQINFARQPPRNLTAYTVFARLAPGVSFAQAQDELTTIAGQLRAEVPVHDASELRVKIIPFLHDVVKGARSGLWMLMAAVGLLLAIASLNVALLMLARARERDRELLVRVAVGAHRWRIARLVLVESLIVAVGGGLAGVALARIALLTLRARALSNVPRVEDVSIDLGVLAFAAAVSALSAVAFAVVPAMRASRLDVADALRAAAIGSRSRVGGRGRDLLIVTQLALGLVLVVGAVQVVFSFRALAAASPGFDPRHTLTARVSTPPGPQFTTPAAAHAYHEAVRGRLAALPGVAAVGAASQLPLTGQGPLQPYAYDAETARNWEQLSADSFGITPGYFAALGATLLAGRDLTSDEIANGRRVIVIDDSLAQRAFGTPARAVGRLLQLEPEAQPESFFEIVGVVAHMRAHDLRRQQLPQIYHGRLFRTYSVAIRGDANVGALANAVRAAIAEVRPGTAVQDVRQLGAIVDEALGPMRLAVWLMTAFGVLALTLAAVGIYGVFSYFVSERTHEISVRLALGATPSAVRRLVVGRGLSLTLTGLAAGLTAAIAISGVAARLLYEVNALGVRSYAAAAVCVSLVAVAACWLPAHRASRVDPQQGLRQT